MFCKYIILKKNFVPIIFHSAIEHVQEAQGREVKSAGFVFIDFVNKTVRCTGNSVSLGGIESDPELDSKLILNMLTG